MTMCKHLLRLSVWFISLKSMSLYASLPAVSLLGDNPCNPIHVIACGLPYPSDVYAKSEPNSETGIALEFPVGIFDEALFKEVPPTLSFQTAFNGTTGFSAATSVLFELDEIPDLSSVPTDGGEAVVAFSLTSGERIPINAAVNEYARSNLVSAKSQIIEVYPRSRWPFAEKIVVAVTKQVKTDVGEAFEPNEAFKQAIAQDGSALSEFYEPAISFLEEKGIDRASLVSATFFTVRTEREVTERLIRLGNIVYNKPRPIRNVKVSYRYLSSAAALVTGEFLSENFRRQSDGGIDYLLDGGEDYWIKFRLTLPASSRKKPAPVSVYGHGLGLFKESDRIVSRVNAKAGVATLSIDLPNHGSRIKTDGGYTLALVSTKNVTKQLGMIVQSTIDYMALLKMLKTSLADIDVLPGRLFAHDGDGRPDIDVNNIMYQGTSLGGVLGSTFVAIAPDIQGAYFQVTGVGFTNILSASIVWPLFFHNLVPDQATGAEALMLKSAVQQEMDYGDGINFVHYFREPPPGVTEKKVAVVIGDNDSVVTNTSSIALADLAKIPFINTRNRVEPLPLASVADDFVDGYGIFKVTMPKTGTLIDDLIAHIIFVGPKPTRIMRRWMEQYVVGPDR